MPVRRKNPRGGAPPTQNLREYRRRTPTTPTHGVPHPFRDGYAAAPQWLPRSLPRPLPYSPSCSSTAQNIGLTPSRPNHFLRLSRNRTRRSSPPRISSAPHSAQPVMPRNSPHG